MSDHLVKCPHCGKLSYPGTNHTCRPKQKTTEEIAAEWIAEKDWDYQKYNDKRKDRSAYDTRMLYEISELLEWAFLEGYHAGYDAGEDDLERERMRLSACGVAAMSNTDESVAKRINSGSPYYSASYRDVCDAVDREMQWKALAEEWERDYDKLKEKHEPMIAITSEENP